MVNYRYNILKKLGEGGSGEVFLAEDTRRKNQQVAIKILHPVETIGAEADEAFHNEVSSLVNLLHPNLVRIFDFGTIRHAEPSSLQKRRFFTMEFIRGQDSLEWTSTCEHEEAKDSLLEMLLLQSLSVLSYVHREGVIHFDIKPQNLVLVGEKATTATPLLKLTDFGFSKRVDDSLNIPIRGTLEYTAPELLKGDAYDHRIDLYSLGATFYHLLEGHCPFVAKGPMELAKRVLSDEVEFSTPLASSSSHLREVIGLLMKKDPAHRAQSAEHAARTLVAKIPKGKEIFESYFGFSRASRFVGRKNELKIIGGAAASLTPEGVWSEQMAVVVSGGEGIGKTTLVKEALKSARARELSVYEIESVQTDVPFGGIAALLDLISSDVQSFSEQGKKVFEKYDSLIGFRREENARFEAWGRSKENVVELMSRFIVECSEVFPFIIFVDNAQLLDESSVSVLRIAIRGANAGRLLLLAAETAEKANVFSPPFAKELNLHELSAEEISEMSESLFGAGHAANEIASQIYGLYGGTPGIVVEAFNAVHTLVPGDALRDTATAKEYIEMLESKLPHNIDDFLFGRYQKLSRERQLILSMLSCFRYPARTSVVVRLLPFHPERSADHIRFLQLDGFVGMAENESSLFIRMKKLKEAVSETLKAERNQLHELIASTLEQDSENADFTQLQELAFQHAECRTYEKACTYYARAADEGIKLFAHQRALQLYRDAIAAAKLTSDAQRECMLEVKYASALFLAGLYREAIDLGRELALRPQLKSSEKIPLFKVIGLSSSRLGENEQAQEYINLVLQFSVNKIERLELRQELIGLQISAGHFKEAENESVEQLAYAKEIKNDRLAGAIYTDLGITAFFQDKFDYAVQCFSDAMKTYEELNEKTQVINSMINIGNALSGKGDYAQAIAYWEKALASSQEYGTLSQQAHIQNNLGIAYYNLKEYDKAKQLYDEACSKYDRINSKVGVAGVLTNLGEVSLVECEYEMALARFAEANELFRTMDNSYEQVQSCLHIAQVLLILGDQEKAEMQLEEAGKLIVNKSQETFRPRYDFLSGIAKLQRREYDSACTAFTNAISLYRKEQAKEPLWLSILRLAECLMLQGKYTEAVHVADEVLKESDAMKKPHIIAEADYLLGKIAAARSNIGLEKPLLYFKQGIELLAKEPVSETTWKLSFALAREYYERGQRERSKEFLVKTKLILLFFLSHFTSSDLKEKYLKVDQKERVFATIETFTRNKEQ